MATKIRQSNLDTSVVTGLTELAEARADGDFVLVYDSSAGTLKKIQGSNLGLVGPKISSVTPTNALTGDGTGNHTFIINGTNFASGATAKLIKSDGTSVAFDTLTRNSDIKLTGVIAKSSVPGAGEPYDVSVTANQLTVTLTDQINIDQSPVFATDAGSLGTVLNGLVGSTNLFVVASDPESAGNVSFELQSGSLPAGASTAVVNENGVSKLKISGFNAVGSNTTSNFVVRAVDAASNTTSRAYSITVNAPVSQTFNSSGTFSVPSGVANVDVLVIAGGGGGKPTSGDTVGGGGAGGLIFMPNSPVTPGGTVSVTVGSGGGSGSSGQDSAFGTLTAKGGGSGGGQPQPDSSGRPGGSGGGGGRGDYGSSGGTATQPTQPGNSGAYGFGNNGGASLGQTGIGAGGGGGAGGTGGNSFGSQPHGGGVGGVGKAYTIADGTTPVGYAGGGSGNRGGQVQGRDPQFGGGTPATNADYGPAGQAISQGTINGTANRGGGGSFNASGGKGVVIVRY